jgi:DNA polymerase III delta subunit
VHLAVLRQPLRAAGRAIAAGDRLIALARDLPDGAALALIDVRSTRDAGRMPPLLTRLAHAVVTRGGVVEERIAPRRGELQAWIRSRAEQIGNAIDPRAAAVLAERIGGTVSESDIERGEQTRIAAAELDKLATYAAGRPINAADVEELVADTRPASLFAITNAVDRREPAAAASALSRALAEGQPVLRILGALQGRISDLIVARDLAASGAQPAELTKRVGRGNARMAERLVEAARRYSGAELEAMLTGLFEADLAIKTNAMEAEPALVAWLGDYLIGRPRAARGG